MCGDKDGAGFANFGNRANVRDRGTRDSSRMHVVSLFNPNSLILLVSSSRKMGSKEDEASMYFSEIRIG